MTLVAQTSDLWKLAVAAIAILSVAGCGWVESYKATVHSGRTAVPVAVEMEEMFPETDHFITEFGIGRGPWTWNTTSYFGGRYSLSMAVMVDIDYGAKQVRQVGEPDFHLHEVESVEHVTKGIDAASYSRDFPFGIEQWRQVVAAHGDFDAIGFECKPDAVPGFADHVAEVRRDIVHVSLTGEPR